MIEEMEAAWISEELAGLSVKDKRQRKRAGQVIAAMFAEPGASVRRMFGQKAGAKGLYRLVEGEGKKSISAAEVTYAQQQATLQRCAGEELVLCVQDTTDVNISQFTSMAGGGALPRGQGARRGFFAQTVLAVSATGVPLGVLGQHYFEREAARTKGRQAHEHKTKPIEEKESYKWLRGVLESGVEQVSGTTMLFVSDQESDIFEYLALPRPAHVQLLLRSQHNRRLTASPADKESNAAGSEGKLWDVVQAAPVAGVIDVPVHSKASQVARIARCEVRYQQVTLPAPPKTPALQQALAAAGSAFSDPAPVTAWMVIVSEIPAQDPAQPKQKQAKARATAKPDQPEQPEQPEQPDQPILWRLLTTLPVTSFADASAMARYYARRWLVERFHYVLKSGCNIEARRLGSVENLQRFLSLANIVAWRLLWLTYVARETPDAPCTVALSTVEWKALVTAIHQGKQAPLQPPSLRQAVRWIAQLGGFLGRRSDGEPGVTVLWHGWQKLANYAQMYRILAPHDDHSNFGYI